MKERTRNNNENTFAGDRFDAMARYGLGYNSLEKLAAAANAKIKIGRRTIYNYSKIDKYLNEITEV